VLKLHAHLYDVSNAFYRFFHVSLADLMSLLIEGLRHAPKLNQPFIPDTAPVRRVHLNADQSPQPTHIPQTHSMSPANPNSPHISTETSWENKEHKVPMSTRDVWTPGNRPNLFNGLLEKAKTVRQADFYDPYFPLRFVEVPKCT
jgi:chromatin structure-remodeling complex subunit RSC9